MPVAKKRAKKISTVDTELIELLKEHMKSEGSRITSIDDRLDNHIKIYQANGVEAKRVADNLATLITQISSFGSNICSLEEKVNKMYKENVEPVYKEYEGEQFRQTKNKATMVSFVLWGSVVAALITIASFIGKIGTK